MSTERVDLGSGYSYTKFSWHPDRKLNPRYDGIPDVEWLGIIIGCPHNPEHGGGIQLSISPEVDAVFAGAKWEVEQWEPLTISPSISMQNCGCHGYIREGKWVSA